MEANLVGQPYQVPLVLPMFDGSVPAGFPSPAEDYMEAPLDLTEFLERFRLEETSTALMDDRIDVVRKKIQIKPIHSEIGHAGGLPGFFIAFTASDPHTAQLVCAEITSLFVNENLRTGEASAEGTTDFLKEQLQG